MGKITCCQRCEGALDRCKDDLCCLCEMRARAESAERRADTQAAYLREIAEAFGTRGSTPLVSLTKEMREDLARARARVEELRRLGGAMCDRIESWLDPNCEKAAAWRRATEAAGKDEE